MGEYEKYQKIFKGNVDDTKACYLTFFTWDELSDENKLTFGETINVEVAFGADAYNELAKLRIKAKAHSKKAATSSSAAAKASSRMGTQ